MISPEATLVAATWREETHFIVIPFHQMKLMFLLRCQYLSYVLFSVEVICLLFLDQTACEPLPIFKDLFTLWFLLVSRLLYEIEKVKCLLGPLTSSGRRLVLPVKCTQPERSWPPVNCSVCSSSNWKVKGSNQSKLQGLVCLISRDIPGISVLWYDFCHCSLLSHPSSNKIKLSSSL